MQQLAPATTPTADTCAACSAESPTIPSATVPGAYLCADTRACLRRACPPNPHITGRNRRGLALDRFGRRRLRA